MARRKRKIDMLSGLPDEVLLHILSFLPTKLSVSTSVLAKRWRFLWVQVPNLEFEGDHLDDINRVVMLHEANTVDTFSLLDVKCSAYQLETLIIHPIKRSVRNLYIECVDDIMWALPRFLLTCKTLVDLKLDSCAEIPSSGELFLPSLKKLYLCFVKYEHDECFPHLISGCPVLEELILHDCYKEEESNPSCIIVSSPTIKTLEVDFTPLRHDDPEKMLIIDLPALIHLNMFCHDLEYVQSLRKSMTSLIKAQITFPACLMCDIDCIMHARSIEFISCICHLSYLKISRVVCDLLVDIEGTGSMPKFVNLTKLDFDLTVDWHYLATFLEVADNLEVLTINLRETHPYKEPKQVPPCMLSSLRTVRMNHFRACEDAFDMVRYILRNAQVLERMEISYKSSSNKKKLDALQRISLFERVSKSCQVAFNTD